MNPDRVKIEKAIRRIQSGELSPAAATEMLLEEMRQSESRDMSSVAHLETLSQLIARLGPPPRDVLDRWCEQVESFTILSQAASLAFPPIDPDRWSLDRHGELLLPDHQVPNIDVGSVPSDVRESARRHAALFRQQLTTQDGTPQEASAQAKSLPIEANLQTRPLLAGRGTPTKSSRAQGVPLRWYRRALVSGLLVLSVVAMGVISWKASRKTSPSVAQPVGPPGHADGISQRSDTTSSNPEPEMVSTTQSMSVPITKHSEAVSTDVLPDQLETFQPDSSDHELSIPGSDEWLSLDAIIPAMPMLSTESDSFLASSSNQKNKPLGETRDSETVSDSVAAMSTLAGGDDPLAESSGADQPDESPQPTRQAGETAVGLPAADDADSRVLLAPFALSSPSLDFPIEVGVDLSQADSDAIDADSAATWMFVQRTSKDTLANILVDQDQSEFRWTTAAKRSSLANLIRHGRLRDSSGQLIFLRPKIVSEPYAISFDASDARPSWDLLTPLPPRVTRVSIQFDLPEATKSGDGIELGWIEPVDSTSPRRTRGLAVLKPSDGETIEVGIRFDLTCSRKLSARVRTFGRLDSTMPWQLISRPILENAADQITRRSIRLSQMSTEMSMMYARASSDRRSDLRPQRDAIEEQSKRLTELSKRLAELQSLVNKIENGVLVRLRLWVQWPESTQDLFIMVATNEE